MGKYIHSESEFMFKPMTQIPVVCAVFNTKMYRARMLEMYFYPILQL